MKADPGLRDALHVSGNGWQIDAQGIGVWAVVIIVLGVVLAVLAVVVRLKLHTRIPPALRKALLGWVGAGQTTPREVSDSVPGAPRQSGLDNSV